MPLQFALKRLSQEGVDFLKGDSPLLPFVSHETVTVTESREEVLLNLCHQIASATPSAPRPGPWQPVSSMVSSDLSLAASHRPERQRLARVLRFLPGRHTSQPAADWGSPACSGAAMLSGLGLCVKVAVLTPWTEVGAKPLVSAWPGPETQL